MYLKRLEIQGFKSFATKTEFDFNGGITAVVGPNGSGKSNIADAIRWVLGEQSNRLIRTKKLEDVIFAGSSLRAPVGMAEVSLTIDNSEGKLPLDFSEVTISRRAYRSGESEYLINNSKVRYRDVVDLLLKVNFGQNGYTVVGQGMIEALLTLRPEEKRILLEEAADIKKYRVRVDEAQERLQATLQNLDRVSLVVGEIAPRLGQLEKQAKKAREYQEVANELSSLLEKWYGCRWRLVEETLARARVASEGHQLEREKYRSTMTEVENRLQEAREQRKEKRAELSEFQLQRQELAHRFDELSQTIAVSGERLEMWARQKEELVSELAPLESVVLSQTKEINEVEERLHILEKEIRTRLDGVAKWQGELDRIGVRRREIERKLETERQRTLNLEAKEAHIQNQLIHIDERLIELEAETGKIAAVKEKQIVELANGQSALDLIRREQIALEKQLERLQEEGKHLAESSQAIESRIDVLEKAIQALRRQLESQETRLDMIARAKRELVGLDSGVKAVLKASLPQTGASNEKASDGVSAGNNEQTQHKLAGIVDVLSNLIEVPPGLEDAIEAALDGHLHDIITTSWNDTESAIEFLLAQGKGRASFLPLDTTKEAFPLNLISERGVLGVASKLVKCEPRYRRLIDVLLGRTVVVENLAVARRIISRGLGNVVTRRGELLRPSGAVTGGSLRGKQEESTLAMERDFRNLPSTIVKTKEKIDRVQVRIEERRADLAANREALATLSERETRLNSELKTKEKELSAKERDLENQKREIQWQDNLIKKAVDEKEQLEHKRLALQAQKESCLTEKEIAQQSARSVQGEINALQGSQSSLSQWIMEARTNLAAMEGEKKSRIALRENYRNSINRLQSQIESKTKRRKELEERSIALASELDRAKLEGSEVRQQLMAMDELVRPLTELVNGLEGEEAGLVEEEARLQRRLLELERLVAQAEAEERRAEEELAGLQAMIEADNLVRNSREHLQSNARDTEEAVDMEKLKRRIDLLRPRVRSMESVNPNAVQEYEETKERHDFLSGQTEDLRQAEASIRQAIVELEEIIKSQFESTFQTVNVEFMRYFTTFFGGGTAKLVLMSGDNGNQPGVDVIAQPPGKRVRSLTTLSGGERSLTAAALIFAILQVNPTPFCVMDEVDAALDEANVVRFAEALRQLSQSTQFILITHNRGTIEMANNIYGISMGDDKVSKVLSLRLDNKVSQLA